MKKKVAGIIVLFLVMIIFVFSGCALNGQKNPTKTNEHFLSATRSATMENKAVKPLGVGFSWSYDLKVSNYKNSLKFSEITMHVNDDIKNGKTEIDFPGVLFRDGAPRRLTLGSGNPPKLLNLSTYSYEAVPQGMDTTSYQPSFDADYKAYLSSEGFSLTKNIDGSHELYTKTDGTIRYETVVNTYNDVPETITVYQNGIPVSNEVVQIQSRDGFALPQKITMTNKAVNLEPGVPREEMTSILEFTITSFETFPVIPPIEP